MTTRIHAEHNLSPAELVKAMVSLACDEGIVDELPLAIEKAQRLEVTWPREPYMLHIVQSLDTKRREALDHLGENLVRWVDRLFPARSRWSLFKAVPGVQLTAAQIEELRMLIAAHFQPAGVEMGGGVYRIPDDVLDRWRADGIIVPGIRLTEIGDAYQAGRLVQVVEEGATFAAMKHLAVRLPTTQVQRYAIEWLEQHATRYMVGFGDRLGATAFDRALGLNQRLARKMIVAYQRRELKVIRPVEGPAHDLTEAARRALETDRVADDWRTLARQLFKTFRGSESRRDWLRVANAETRLAYNVGRVHTFAEGGIEQMYYLVHADACPACKRTYLHPDGTPKIFTVDRILDNIDQTGGLNIGRKASMIGDEQLGWIATGLLHNW